MIWRRLAILALLAALPCAGQSAAPLAASAGTLSERSTLPPQTGNSGKYLTTNGTAASWGTVSGGTPGGSSGEIQWNNGGALAGGGPTWDSTTKTFTVPTANSATNGGLLIQSTADSTAAYAFASFGDTHSGTFRQHGFLGNAGGSPGSVLFWAMPGWELGIRTYGAQPLDIKSGQLLALSAATDITLTPGGATKITALQVVSGVRPTCYATTRGTVWYVAGGTGVADTFEVCAKASADSYSWTALATIP